MGDWKFFTYSFFLVLIIFGSGAFVGNFFGAPIAREKAFSEAREKFDAPVYFPSLRNVKITVFDESDYSCSKINNSWGCTEVSEENGMTYGLTKINFFKNRTRQNFETTCNHEMLHVIIRSANWQKIVFGLPFNYESKRSAENKISSMMDYR